MKVYIMLTSTLVVTLALVLTWEASVRADECEMCRANTVPQSTCDDCTNVVYMVGGQPLPVSYRRIPDPGHTWPDGKYCDPMNGDGFECDIAELECENATGKLTLGQHFCVGPETDEEDCANDQNVCEDMENEELECS